MDYRGRIVLRGNDSFLVTRITVDGVFECIDLNDLMKTTKTLYMLDPIISTVYKTRELVLGYNMFSYNSFSIFPNIDIHNIINAYGFIGNKEDTGYVIVFECMDCSYIFEVLYGEVYGVCIKNYTLNLSESSFIKSDCKEVNTDGYSDLLEIPSDVLYRYKYSLPEGSFVTLEKLFSYFPKGIKVELPLLSGRSGSGLCLSLFNGEEYSIRTLRDCESYLESDGRILPEDVYVGMEDTYDYPCAYFNGVELDKLCDILLKNGYESVISDVRKNNGIKSNFKVPDSEDYIGIKDYEGDDTYTLNLLRLHDVKSINGVILYTELRMYNLCKSVDYIVLCSSFDRDVCKKLQSLKYANLIRGRLIKLKSFPYELTDIQDSVERVYFRYTVRGEETIYEAEYLKRSDKWNYIVKSDVDDDADFLNVLLQLLDRIANVSIYEPNRYSVYVMEGGKVSINNDTCVGSVEKFQNCRNLINASKQNEFLIVKWKYDTRDCMWIFNKKEKSLVKL